MFDPSVGANPPSTARNRVDSSSFVTQSYFLGRRVVVSYGRRRDAVDIYQDPAPQANWNFDELLRTIDWQKVRHEVPINTVKSAVLHPLSWVSFAYSKTTSKQVRTEVVRNPDGSIVPTGSGIGKDYGITRGPSGNRRTAGSRWTVAQRPDCWGQNQAHSPGCVPPGTKTLESHFVMPRKADAIYVGEQKVSFAPGAPRSVAVRPGAAIFLRKGTAAVGVRAPVARALDGMAASMSLVWDDNEWEAIRLTVDHRINDLPAKTKAAVALHVRVGSELDEAAFAAFRRTFAAAKSDVVLEQDKISVQSPTMTAGKTLAIVAEAPWAKPSRLQPAPSTAVLEIDGQDVGRQLFDTAR